MKGFAYTILIVILSSVMLQPFVEVIHVTTEKAKVGSALRNSGKLAALRSVGDMDRGDLNSGIELDTFRERFNEGFEKSLNLSVVNSSGDESTFSSNDGRFNTFLVRFTVYRQPDEITGMPVGYCRIAVQSKYKFIMGYLKAAEKLTGGMDSFNLHCYDVFAVDISN